MSTNREIIQLHIGQAGVQIASACWELYCLEHGICVDGILHTECIENDFNPFFSYMGNRRVVPRLVMADLEPSPIDEIRTGCYRNLFHPQSLVTGKEDAASIFTRGRITLGREMIDVTMDRIRMQAEDCGSLQGFLMYRAVGGGTGSGFGDLIFEQLDDCYGKASKVEFTVFPSPKISPIIVEPYNAVLATHSGLDYVNCSFLLDNEALYDICDRNLHVPNPTYTNLNRVIGQAISGVTTSLRFPGSINVNLLEFQTNLVPFPRIHFPLVTLAPIADEKSGLHESLTTGKITNQCFEPSNQLVKCDPRRGLYMSCVLLYRGDVNPTEINRAIDQIKQKKIIRFVNWSPTGFKIGINFQPPTTVPGGDLAPTQRAVVMLSNHTGIKRAWRRMFNKFNLLYSKKAFFHHFLNEGLDEDCLRDANENLRLLICDYTEIEKGECTCPNGKKSLFCDSIPKTMANDRDDFCSRLIKKNK